jgi:hypothetical protein
LTNNTKDFVNRGASVLAVSEKLKRRESIDIVVKKVLEVDRSYQLNNTILNSNSKISISGK